MSFSGLVSKEPGAIQGPPGTLEALPSPGRQRFRVRHKNPWARVPGSPYGARKRRDRARAGTASRSPKWGGMDGKESERLILPVKLGNRPHGTQWREGGS